MKTTLLVTITHPADISASGFIDHAIRPVIGELDTASPDGWTVSVTRIDGAETAALRAALSVFLSDWPENATPDTVLEMVAAEDSRVLFWEPVEDWPGESLAAAIEDAQGAILSEWEQLSGGAR